MEKPRLSSLNQLLHPTARALRGQQGQQLLVCTAPAAPTTGGHSYCGKQREGTQRGTLSWLALARTGTFLLFYHWS